MLNTYYKTFDAEAYFKCKPKEKDILKELKRKRVRKTDIKIVRLKLFKDANLKDDDKKIIHRKN